MYSDGLYKHTESRTNVPHHYLIPAGQGTQAEADMAGDSPEGTGSGLWKQDAYTVPQAMERHLSSEQKSGREDVGIESQKRPFCTRNDDSTHVPHRC